MGSKQLPARWENDLERWRENGIIDAATAERIGAFEEQRAAAQGLSWPVRIAIAFGGLLLGAGVLLFVAAHWDELSPAIRFSLVLALVALFHGGAACMAQRFAVLATTGHAVGTVCLGAGIFLAGQIFHLQEHWPSGVLLWAMGAAIGFALLRHWPQAGLVALLIPAWLAGEWVEATRLFAGGERPMIEGLLLLAITYLTARTTDKASASRMTLVWIGALSLLPLATWAGVGGIYPWQRTPMPTHYQAIGWIVALGSPLLLACYLRGAARRWNLLAALWVVILGSMGFNGRPATGGTGHFWPEFAPYIMWAIGAIGLIAWGLQEARKERINLGVAGFALTVIAFYFSTVMDKLGRSASLIGMGLLFLLGGWLLEKTRRRLLAQVGSEGQ